MTILLRQGILSSISLILAVSLSFFAVPISGTQTGNLSGINFISFASDINSTTNNKIRVCNDPSFLTSGGPQTVVNSPRYVLASSNTTICQKWIDSDGLSSWAFNDNASGSWLAKNITGSFSGTTAWSNVTIFVGPDTTKNIAYKFWANNTLNVWAQGKWNGSNIDVMPIVWNRFNPRYFAQVNSKPAAYIKHSLGRAEVYDSLTKLYFIFWSNVSSALFYNYSSDGFTWRNGAFVARDPDPVGSGGGKFYINTGTLNGASYIYYIRCNEQVNAPIRFRRGHIFANGTIAWVPESIIADGTNVYQQAVNGIAQTPAGYVWASYWCNWDNGTQRVYASFTQSTNGTWITYSGYPKSVFNDLDTSYNEAYIYEINDTSAYVITTLANNYGFINGKEIANHVLLSVQNVSGYKTSPLCLVTGRDFNGLSQGHNIYLVYHSIDEKIRFTQIDTTTDTLSVKDSIISSEAIDADTYPIIDYDLSYNILNCNWATSDGSIWLAQNNSSAWSSRVRIGVIPTGTNLFEDPNSIIEYSFGHALLDVMVTDSNSYKWIWTLLYTVSEPECIELTYNTTIPGNPCKINSKWLSTFGLSGGQHATNNSGTYETSKWNTLDNMTQAWINFTTNLNSTAKSVAFSIAANDTNNIWGNTTFAISISPRIDEFQQIIALPSYIIMTLVTTALYWIERQRKQFSQRVRKA